MNVKTIFKFSLIIVLLGVFACETEDMLNSRMASELFEFNEVNDSRFSLREWDCVSPLRYKLTTWSGNIVGAVEVFVENDKLVYQFSLVNGYADWEIFRAYLFIGSKADWETALSDLSIIAPPGVNDWPKIIPVDDAIDFDPVGNTVTYEIDLEEIGEDCFIWAAKVSFRNGSNVMHSYVIVDESKYTWDEELQVVENDEICLAQCDRPGTGTQGYWKNHPDAWPVEEITVGGVTYSKEDAIIEMEKPAKGDKTYSMFEQLVAAMLNVMIGNDDSCIAETISAADDWFKDFPLGSGIGASNNAWKDPGSDLHTMLDEYNNGLLPCADHRD
jgi:hypothetical protein